MQVIKKLMIVVLLSYCFTSAFANIITIHPNKSTLKEIFTWKFENQDDGMYFLLGPESTNALVLHVNKLASTGAAADHVTVNCNATRYRIDPDQSLTCYGNFSDVVTMYIAPQDFHNGAEGTYRYEPISK